MQTPSPKITLPIKIFKVVYKTYFSHPLCIGAKIGRKTKGEILEKFSLDSNSFFSKITSWFFPQTISWELSIWENLFDKVFSLIFFSSRSHGWPNLWEKSIFNEVFWVANSLVFRYSRVRFILQGLELQFPFYKGNATESWIVLLLVSESWDQPPKNTSSNDSNWIFELKFLHKDQLELSTKALP